MGVNLESDDYLQAKNAMFSLAHALGKNKQQQDDLIKALKVIELENEPDENIIRDMLGLFLDGLSYGNWPWTLHARLVKD